MWEAVRVMSESVGISALCAVSSAAIWGVSLMEVGEGLMQTTLTSASCMVRDGHEPSEGVRG
jgi:hypothetical protein